MARIKQLKKIQKEVNKIIRSLNKELKEDCFAGRFKVLQTLRIDHHIEDDYYTSIYRFTFIDTEQPERNVDKWIDTYSMFSFKYDLHLSLISSSLDILEGFSQQYHLAQSCTILLILRVITLHEPVITPVRPDVGLKVFSDSSFLNLQHDARLSALSDI